MNVCAITNVYNESFNLPIWLRHYGAQVGIGNCVVVDHGSNDGSTENLKGANIIRLPRSEFNDHIRARLIAGIANALLNSFDAVIYSDCDEILVVDPAQYRDLVEFCAAMKCPGATAIGLNVVHHLGTEDPICSTAPILGQRKFVQFVSPMCKTVVVRKPVTWGGGFHSCNHAPHFGHLYLFHLRWLDLGECLKRLSTTRTVRFADDKAGPHHRAKYEDFLKAFQQITTRSISEDFEFDAQLDQVRGLVSVNSDGLYVIQGDVRSEKLLQIPDRFYDIF